MSENTKYRHPEGIYILEVLSNTLSKNTKQTYVVLNCKVVSMKKGDSKNFKPNQWRSVNLWTTEACLDRTKTFLKAAGFPDGVSAARLHKDDPNHVSLAGFQFDASCSINEKGYDEFSALPVGGGKGSGDSAAGKWMDELPKPSTSELMKLDEMFGIAAKPASAPAAPVAGGTRKARW